MCAADKDFDRAAADCRFGEDAMNNQVFGCKSALLALLLTTALASPAFAQEAMPPEDDSAVGEIVVTAQKRSESAQRIGSALNPSAAKRSHGLGSRICFRRSPWFQVSSFRVRRTMGWR